MNVRKASPDDLRQLAELRWEFQKPSGNDSETVREDFLRYCARFLENGLEDGTWVYWVAEADGLIVSHAFVQRIRKVPRPGCLIGEFGYLTNVYTRPEYRRRGYGGRLLDTIREWAGEEGLELLIVWPSRESAGFYEKAGYSAENEIMELITMP